MLTKGEYSAFLHPNDYRRMHNVAADEILWGLDKDEDGFVSVDEYLGKQYEIEFNILLSSINPQKTFLNPEGNQTCNLLMTGDTF